MSKNFVVPPKRIKADKAKIKFCPVCCGEVEVFKAVLKCKKCDRAFFIIHTSSSTSTIEED